MTQPIEIRAFSCLIPAGTPIATPFTVAMAQPPRVVTGVRLRIPPGPNGNVGFRLSTKGAQVVPTAGTDWIIASEEIIDWDFELPLESGAWELVGYNTGVYDHTIYVQFKLALIGSNAPAQFFTPIAADVISAPVASVAADAGNAVLSG